LDEILGLLDSAIGFWDAVVPVLMSLLLSFIVYLMYQKFYASKHIGAGVHRTFLLGGPAITMLFLVIQASVPLGLGLLGALSFIRFRTPIKDPAEIGYVLLMICCSIGAATGNYIITFILLAIVFAAVLIQWLSRNSFASDGLSDIVITLNQDTFNSVEGKLQGLLKQRLSGLRLETVSLAENRVNLHYQYQRRTGFNAAAFTNEIKEFVGAGDIEVFIG
jgi:hypothetical protein